MRRLRDRRLSGLFRGGEMPRLLTMVLMLFVLAMMMRRAGDENTWRFFTGEPRGAQQAGAEVASSPSLKRKRRSRSNKALAPAAAATAEPPSETAAPNSAPDAGIQLAAASAAPPAARLEPEPKSEPTSETGTNDERVKPRAGAPAETKPEAIVVAQTPANPAAENKAESAAEPKPAVQSPSAPTDSASAGRDPQAAAQGESPEDRGARSPAGPVVPLFRPHLPSHPEIIYQPGEQPVSEPEPLDEDPAELEAFEYEVQALTDQAPLAKEEMIAYWRLMRWEQAQTAEQMLKRARGDVRFDDLLSRPEEHRGELIKAKLHIVQLLKFSDLPENPLGLTTQYQAAGCNDASQAWFYICVFTDLPEGMHVGDRVFEEGTFVGFFLKTMVYEDGKGTRIKAPILIGRMIHHERPVVPHSETEWMWPWIAGGVVLVLYAARWGWRHVYGRNPEPAVRGILTRRTLDEEGEGFVIEDWLEQVEAPGVQKESHPAAERDFKGSSHGASHADGLPDRDRHGLDWTEDRER